MTARLSLTPLRALAASGMLLSLLGCSQNGSQTAPSPTNAATPATDAAILSTLVHTFTEDYATGQAPLGLFDFVLDPRTNEFDITPTRAATAVGLGANIATDVTSALSTATFGCPTCFQVTGLDREVIDGQIVVSIDLKVRHPFVSPSLPTSRADLHINNVRALVMATGSQAFYGDSPSDPEVTGNVGLIRNADGYSSPPQTFLPLPVGVTGNLFPFKVFETGDNLTAPTGNFSPTTGWSTVTSDPQGFNVLKMGGEATTTVQFVLAGSQTAQVSGRVMLLSNFIVSAANRSQRPTPQYFMPEGAMLEPWHVAVNVPGPFLLPGAENGDVTVEVTDWQAGYSQDPNYPDAANPDGLFFDSIPTTVQIDIPDFQAGSAFGPVGTPTSGAGTLADPFIYTIPITKPAGQAQGRYPVLVKIIDTRTTQDALDASLSVATGLSTIDSIVTYQTAFIEVGNTDTPPVCGGYTTIPAPVAGTVTVNPSEAVTASFDGTNDDNGITLVEMDWNYDGTFALPAEPAYRSTASLADINFSYVTLGFYTVALRFTDTIGQVSNPNDCTFTVNVSTASQPPTCGGFTINGNPPGPLSIGGGCPVTLAFDWTNDPDANINYVEVDWAYDGTFAGAAEPNYDQLFESASVDQLTRSLQATTTLALRWTDHDAGSNDPASCTFVISVSGGIVGGPLSILPGSNALNPARIQAVDHRNPIASFGDNVYVYIRQSGGLNSSYIFRSADGGATWGPGLEVGDAGVGTGTGGAGNLTTASIATTANGNVLLFGFEYSGGFQPWFNRLNPTGTNTLAFDPLATTVLLGSTGCGGGPLTSDLWGTGGHFDPSVQGDPTDANIAYLHGTDAAGCSGSTSDIVRLVRINNADSGAPTFTFVGNTFSSPGQSNFEPIIRVDYEGDVHCLTKNTSLLKYKEYKKGAGSIPADQTLTGIVGVPFNQYMAIGGDNLPVVAYDLSSDVYLIKGSNAVAPTFTGSTPVLATSSVTSTQVRPFVDVDRTNNNIFVTYGDNRYGGTESSLARLATTLSAWNSTLTTPLLCDLQIDGPGSFDNNGSFGDSILHITQHFSPTAKRYLAFYLDGDASASTDPLTYRIYQ